MPGNGWKDTPQAKQPIPYIWHVVIPNNTTSVCQRFQALFRQLCPSTSIKPSPRDNASTSTGLHTRCHTTESPGLDTEMGVCVNLLTSNNLPKSGVHDSLFLQHGQGNTDNQPKLQRCADGAAAASWSVTCQTGPTRVRRWGGGAGVRDGSVRGGRLLPCQSEGCPKHNLRTFRAEMGAEGTSGAPATPRPSSAPPRSGSAAAPAAGGGTGASPHLRRNGHARPKLIKPASPPPPRLWGGNTTFHLYKPPAAGRTGGGSPRESARTEPRTAGRRCRLPRSPRGKPAPGPVPSPPPPPSRSAAAEGTVGAVTCGRPPGGGPRGPGGRCSAGGGGAGFPADSRPPEVRALGSAHPRGGGGGGGERQSKREAAGSWAPLLNPGPAQPRGQRRPPAPQPAPHLPAAPRPFPPPPAPCPAASSRRPDRTGPDQTRPERRGNFPAPDTRGASSPPPRPGRAPHLLCFLPAGAEPPRPRLRPWGRLGPRVTPPRPARGQPHRLRARPPLSARLRRAVPGRGGPIPVRFISVRRRSWPYCGPPLPRRKLKGVRVLALSEFWCQEPSCNTCISSTSSQNGSFRPKLLTPSLNFNQR